MRYSIKGDTLPVVICELDEGEKLLLKVVAWHGCHQI